MRTLNSSSHAGSARGKAARKQTMATDGDGHRRTLRRPSSGGNGQTRTPTMTGWWMTMQPTKTRLRRDGGRAGATWTPGNCGRRTRHMCARFVILNAEAVSALPWTRCATPETRPRRPGEGRRSLPRSPSGWNGRPRNSTRLEPPSRGHATRWMTSTRRWRESASCCAKRSTKLTSGIGGDNASLTTCTPRRARRLRGGITGATTRGRGRSPQEDPRPDVTRVSGHPRGAPGRHVHP